jgi:16S rRNA (uracil1498-N3)-methyltransferase
VSSHRFLAPGLPPPGETLHLDGEEHHHLSRVLRLRPGTEIRVFDGRGAEARATILTVERRRTELRVGEAVLGAVESPLETLLVQSFAGGDRVDLALRRATELGASRLAVLEAERSASTGRRPSEARLGHWQRIAAEAARQCGRRVVPPVILVRSAEPWPRPPAGAPGLLLDPEAEESLADYLADLGPRPGAALAVGPEGGWSARDRDRAREAGYWPVRMGPRILRTEAAGPAALALIQSSWGDLR